MKFASRRAIHAPEMMVVAELRVAKRKTRGKSFIISSPFVDSGILPRVGMIMWVITKTSPNHEIAAISWTHRRSDTSSTIFSQV